MKRFIGLARVSSREQEREGFSLAVQEDALRRYAEREGGEMVRLFRIAETASKSEERKTFKELIAYAEEARRRTGRHPFLQGGPGRPQPLRLRRA